MRHIILSAFGLLAALIIFASFGGINTAEAGQYCKSASTCKAEVAALTRSQDAAARGAQWKVGQSSCRSAAEQQKANERRCRAFDAKWGGKTLEECARCYRQVREDIRRWEACHKASGGIVPPPPAAIYASLARLGQMAGSF